MIKKHIPIQTMDKVFEKRGSNKLAGIFQADREGNILFASPDLTNILGKDNSFHIKKIQEFFPDSHLYNRFLEELLEKSYVPGFEIHHSQRVKYLLMAALLEKKIVGFITPYIKSGDNINLNRDTCFELLEQMRDGVAFIEMNTDGNLGSFIDINSSACQRLGYEKQELIALDPEVLFSTRKQEICQSLCLYGCEGSSHTIETCMLTKDSREIFVELSFQLINNYTKTVLMVVGRDITETKKKQSELMELNKKLYDMATKDHLTEIRNRYYFEKMLKKKISSADRYNEAFSLIMFDIDHFKEINDNFGHNVGDKVLKTIAIIVRKAIRKTDLLAKWAGDEYMILAPVELQASKHVCEKIRNKVNNSALLRPYEVTLSFGVVQYRSGETLEELTSRLDRAMYMAKDQGRNMIVAINMGNNLYLDFEESKSSMPCFDKT